MLFSREYWKRDRRRGVRYEVSAVKYEYHRRQKATPFALESARLKRDVFARKEIDSSSSVVDRCDPTRHDAIDACDLCKYNRCIIPVASWPEFECFPMTRRGIGYFSSRRILKSEAASASLNIFLAKRK